MVANGMISAPQPEAVEAGALVLRRGGNAVDAAMTCALVQGVVDPMMCGIAGFGSLQIYLPSRNIHTYIDFHGKAPSAVTPDMWENLIEGETRDGFGFILRGNVNDVGYQSITVPGSLKAYFEAVTEFGSMAWADIVQPAIDIADAGVMIRPHVHFWYTLRDQLGRVDNEDRLRFSKTGREVYFDANGDALRPGMILKNPDMANTLRRIAKDGADIFYQGEIAAQIADDMKTNGGLLSLADLANYQSQRLDPLWGEYRGYRVATNNPPGGGLMMIEMMNILENFDLTGMGHNSVDYVRILAEAMKYGTIDKDAYIGDPNFFDVPVARLCDKEYAAGLAEKIKNGDRARVQRVERAAESKDTTQVSVLDKDGNAVSMTHSLGMPSGVISDGLGFMYNGCMGVFDPRPGHADSLAPGKSRFSAMAPSLVFKGDNPAPYLVIGAPGGTQINIGVMQAVLNVIDFDMEILEAICAPRFSATSNAIDVTNRIPRYVTDKLAADGYEIIRNPLGFAIAAVHGIKNEAGKLTGAADPGHDGMALAVE